MLRLLRFALLLTGISLLVMSVILLIFRQEEPQSPWLAYISDREGNFEIYRMRLDGTQQVNLTHHPAHDIFLGWGPDGRWLAFASERFQGSSAIYRMSPYGTDITEIDESDYPGQFGLANVSSHSPPIDLPLHASLMSGVGVLLLGLNLALSRLRA